MTVKILCRVPGRPDVVLTLQPNHYERALFASDDDLPAHPPHVSLLLLEDSSGVVSHPGYIDPQKPAEAVQQQLLVTETHSSETREGR